MKKNLNLEIKHERFFFIFGLILITIQVGFILWANFTQLDNHIGFDASTYYLQVMEMVKQGTILPKNWEFQTTLCLDSPVLLAIGIYRLTGNIFLSYGISNILCGILCMSILFNICKEFKLKRLSILIIFNIILTPFLSPFFDNMNDIKYFSVMFVSMSAYSIKISTILMFLLVNIRIILRKIDYSTRCYMFFSLLLTFLVSISSGMYALAFIIVPVSGYFIIVWLLDNKNKINRESIIFILISIGVALLAKLIVSHFIEFNSSDSGLTIIGLKTFWNNIGSIFLGYFDLLNAIPLEANVTIFSKSGIWFICNLSIAIFLLISLFIYVLKNFKYCYVLNAKNLILFCMFFNLILFIFIETTYSSPIFESRYLIPIYFIITFKAIYNLEVNLKSFKLYKFLYTSLIGLLFTVNFLSIFKYNSEKIQKEDYESFILFANNYNTKVVYILDSKDSVFARNLRVLDNRKVYKYTTDLKLPYHWGDYTYYDEISTINKGSLLFSNIDDFSNLPVYIQNKFEKVKENKRYDIYYATNSPIDFVSGITDNDKNIDMMYTSGVNLAEGIFDEDGNYIIDNKEGYVIWGPYKKAIKGTYDFTLNYEIMESDDNIGYFEVSTNNGTNIISKDILEKSKTEIKLKNVEFYDEESLFEYRLYLNKGVKIKLKNIEIIRTK